MFYRYDTIGDQSGWVMVTSGSAIGSQDYVFEVTTLMDSTSEDDGMSQFKVVASMNNGIFHSEPMMGYSIDNIAPGVPDGLMAVANEDNIVLSLES